jgi:demethylmenaquinone methyltransferase/2-methoxy-6-polyprenyl-1,4-benzoquinol methylase
LDFTTFQPVQSEMAKDRILFDSPQEKARYVNRMFAQIAERYDQMNRLMSLGRDLSWRRRAIELAAVPAGGRLLDVATGTGDLALVSLERDPSVSVVGTDFTIEMMQLGRQKENGRTGPGIAWTSGDAMRLPFRDQTFDAVVSGFGMRNVANVRDALGEQRRVLRPGGRVVCLELTFPTLPVWRVLYPWIFGRLMPLVTGYLSGQPAAYRYLPASAANFMRADELAKVMTSVGLRGVGYQKMMLGTVAIHVGLR